jgi:S-disulfanyl-L-cysteine oxidoreductase SoxD
VKIAGLLAIAGCGIIWAQTTRSVWDGVYTEEQAKRGQAAYTQQCSMCHGSELSGADEVPPLSGNEFFSNWNTLSLGELFERIRTTMPADKPGKLSRQQNADFLAYVLSFDKFPAGQAELPTQTEALKQIRFESSKP